jgi:DNA-binding transcriptional LysR family regulator
VNVELRHLRSFVAVAEELSFSRAAQRLHIAQPALSAQIRTLETQLGCRLFARTTRKVELTEHGKLLLGDARAIIGRADAAVLKLKAAARGDRGVLRIGFVAHGAGEIGTEILRRFAEAFPGIETQLVESATLEGIQSQVRDRESDVAFSWLPMSYEELDAEPVAFEGLAVAMATEHVLAARPALRLDDLLGVPIVAPWDDVPFELLRPWIGEVRPDGRRADDPNATGLAECLATASRGLGVYCVPDSVPRFYSRPDLVFRTVVDATPSRVVVIRRRDAENPAVASFVEIARDVATARETVVAIQSDSL